MYQLLLLGLLTTSLLASEESTPATDQMLMVVCTPPISGTWWVGSDCVMAGLGNAPGNVVVQEDVTLTLAAGSVLDIDFLAHHLRILPGARVILEDGAWIE